MQSDGEYRLLKKKKEKNNESYMARKGLVSVASWLLCHSTGNEHPKKKRRRRKKLLVCVCVSHTRATRCYDSRINSRVYIYIYCQNSLAFYNVFCCCSCRLLLLLFYCVRELTWWAGVNPPPEIKGERRKTTLMQLTNRSVRRTHRYTHTHIG